MIARRSLLLAGCIVKPFLGQTSVHEGSLSGRLGRAGKQPVFEAGNGRKVRVTGDEPTNRILLDSRLGGKVFEAKGHSSGADSFTIDPIETRPMVLVDGAKRFRVTYYCDVCSIRTYSPGPCMCCQADTRLDLVDPAFKE